MWYNRVVELVTLRKYIASYREKQIRKGEKTMKRSTKKGFTIVELVIVIAIIAILAAVLIPTFASLIRKANVSKDTQLVRNLNTALVADNAEHKTMTDALKAAAAFGYDVGKINASATGNEILWDSKNDVFCYFKDGKVEYIPETSLKNGEVTTAETYKLWKIYDKAPKDQTFSIYWNSEAAPDFGDKNLTVGFDAGKCLAITALTYKGKTGTSQDVVFRTNGISTVLTIDAENDNVDFYGVAKKIQVENVKNESLHIYGACSELSVTKGHVKVESTGVVFNVESVGTDAKLTNNGYIAKVTASNVTVAGAQVGGDYNIYDLKGLETFRDIVNSGANDFGAIKVVLQKDIRLNDGWTPIGFGGRHNATAKPFSGTFDGNNKTISNLNNKGYNPDGEQIYHDVYQNATNNAKPAYAYGLFGLVKNATIMNLTLTDVDIDTTRANMEGDSVAALVGFGMDDVTITGITVNGAVKAVDAVAGVVGRVYQTTKTSTLTISNCVNNAVITVIKGAADSAKGAGIIGYANNSYTMAKFTVNITDNTNNGVINGYARVAGVAVVNGKQTVWNISGNKNTASGTINIPATYMDKEQSKPSLVAGAILDIGSHQSTSTYNISGNTNEAKVVIGETEQQDVPAEKYPQANSN